MRGRSAICRMVFLMLLAWAASSCGLWKTTAVTVPVERKISAPTHYLVVALAGEGVHVETAERLTRRVRERFAQDNRRVTLSEELVQNPQMSRELAEDFDVLFYQDIERSWNRVQKWTDPIGVDKVLLCRVVGFEETWQRGQKVKRIVVQAACDDIAEATRLAHYQIVAERSGRHISFHDVENLAASRLITQLLTRLEPPVQPSWRAEATARSFEDASAAEILPPLENEEEPDEDIE